MHVVIGDEMKKREVIGAGSCRTSYNTRSHNFG
jgi:hypothetical protein